MEDVTLAMAKAMKEIMTGFRKGAKIATDLLDEGNILEASMLTSKMIETCDECIAEADTIIKSLEGDE
jgi:hypothetical protein